MEDIAVVGIGLRFPGTAKDPEQFWEGLKRGESQWSEFSQDRLNIDGFYHPSGDRQGSVCTSLLGGFELSLTAHRSHFVELIF